MIVNRMFARKLTTMTLVVFLVAGGTFPAIGKENETKKAKPSGGEVVGRIFAVDGKTPVAGATVKAFPLQGEGTVTSAPSDAKGQFALAGLAFGYFDLVVETPQGSFVANQVVNVPPAGKVVVQFALTPYADKSPSWWAGREPRELPGGGAATGSAEMTQNTRGAEFWKSPGGIAIIAGIAGGALLLLASGGNDSSSVSVSPSTPD